MSGQGDGLLEALRASLVEFRMAVEGEDGKKVRAMGDADGFVPEMIRNVLDTVKNTMVGLHEGFATAEHHVRAIDAAMATIEVGMQGLEGLAAGFSFGRPPDDLKDLTAPLQRIGDAMNRGSKALERAQRVIPHVKLRPEQMSSVIDELTSLVGRSESRTGSLTRLVYDIERH